VDNLKVAGAMQTFAQAQGRQQAGTIQIYVAHRTDIFSAFPFTVIFKGHLNWHELSQILRPPSQFSVTDGLM
jgi:hypothetical protein